MRIIVVVDENWGIGCDGDQPFHIPADQRFFRDKTMGKTVVMGRVTLAALPGGVPLKGRKNIVLSRGAFDVDGADVCADLAALSDVLRDAADDVFIIGGQQIYEMLLDYCDYAYVTKIFAAPDVDRHFPNLDALENWQLVKQSETQSHEGLEFCFCEYQNLWPRQLSQGK